MTQGSQEHPEDRPDSGDGAKPTRRGRVTLIVAGLLIVGAAAGLAAVYGNNGPARNAVPANAASGEADATVASGAGEVCRAASETARRIAPLAVGEVAAFSPSLKPTRIPDLAFLKPDGETTRLSSTGAEGLRLINIWATWCVPCRVEMPALDELQEKLGGRDFSVVAINIDTRDPEKPKTFMAETGIKHLALYTDPKAASFQELRAVGRGFGLPTTMLVDAQGCEIGHLAGPAEWASPDAVRLIEAALGRESVQGSAP